MTNPLWFIVPIVAVMVIMGVMFYNVAEKTVVMYNCDIAEISPDFPIEVKEQCRKLRSGRI